MSVTRLASALVLIGIAGATLFLLPAWATLVLAALVAALAGIEISRLSAALGAPVPAVFTAAAAAAAAVALAAPDYWPGGPSAGALALLLLAAATAAGLMALASPTARAPGPAVFIGLAALALSLLYAGLPMGALAGIRALCGPETAAWLLAVVAVSDSAQYYAGTAFGRRPLAPVISPKKTVEGAMGGLVAAPVAGVALAGWGLPGASWHVAALVAILLALAGMAGDLFESLLKRSAHVKDSSALIPGHGGVLDRIDAHLFAAPVFYLIARLAA